MQDGLELFQLWSPWSKESLCEIINYLQVALDFLYQHLGAVKSPSVLHSLHLTLSRGKESSIDDQLHKLRSFLMIQISWSKKRDHRRISSIWNRQALVGTPAVSPICSLPLFACHHWTSYLTSSIPLPLWMLVSTLIHVTCSQCPVHCSSRLWRFWRMSLKGS